MDKEQDKLLVLDTQGHCINVHPSPLADLNLQSCNPFVHDQTIYSLRYMKESVGREGSQTSSVYKCLRVSGGGVRYSDYINLTHLLTIRMRKEESID